MLEAGHSLQWATERNVPHSAKQRKSVRSEVENWLMVMKSSFLKNLNGGKATLQKAAFDSSQS